jgi:hypothetical protein
MVLGLAALLMLASPELANAKRAKRTNNSGLTGGARGRTAKRTRKKRAKTAKTNTRGKARARGARSL